jgi:hypothetical protein
MLGRYREDSLSRATLVPHDAPLLITEINLGARLDQPPHEVDLSKGSSKV